jgi:hypothetical protein
LRWHVIQLFTVCGKNLCRKVRLRPCEIVAHGYIDEAVRERMSESELACNRLGYRDSVIGIGK